MRNRSRQTATPSSPAAPALASLGLVLAMLALGGCGMSRGLDSQWLGAPSAAGDAHNGPVRLTRSDLADLESAIADVTARDYSAARPRLSVLAERFEAGGDPEHAAEAYFWLGYCHEKTASTSAAQVFYQRVIDRYHGTPSAAQARLRMQNLTSPGS